MTVKEVSIAMTPTEEKAITRLQTRRKRLQKKMMGGEEPVQESPDVVAPAVSEPVQTVSVTKPQVSETVQPVQTVSVTNAISESQTGGSKVHIVSHKKHQTRSASQTSGAAKILPTKRHVTVKRKPTLVVGKQIGGMQPPVQPQTLTAAPTQPQPVTAAPVQPQTVTAAPTQPQTVTAAPVQPQTVTAAPVQPQTVTATPTQPQTVTAVPTQPQTVTATPTQPQTAGAMKRKKRFTERRVSISIKNLKATRKHKKSIRKKVKAMDIQTIRAVLMEKGILTAKSNPPEKMLRSMMKDYLLLQANSK